jgi:hypothetical protein
MSLKAGVLLALAYIVPFALLLPPDSTNSPGAIFLWFLYPLTSIVLMLVILVIGHHFFDIDFIPWGLLLLIGSPILTLLFSPVFSLMWGFYIVPTVLVFLVGLMGGD